MSSMGTEDVFVYVEPLGRAFVSANLSNVAHKVRHPRYVVLYIRAFRLTSI